MRPLRLLAAMFKHETNTFSPVPTPIERFFGYRPAMLVGDAAIAAHRRYLPRPGKQEKTQIGQDVAPMNNRDLGRRLAATRVFGRTARKGGHTARRRKATNLLQEILDSDARRAQTVKE